MRIILVLVQFNIQTMFYCWSILKKCDNADKILNHVYVMGSIQLLKSSEYSCFSSFIFDQGKSLSC